MGWKSFTTTVFDWPWLLWRIEDPTDPLASTPLYFKLIPASSIACSKDQASVARKLMSAGTTSSAPNRVSASRCSDAIASWRVELLGAATSREGSSSARLTEIDTGERCNPITDSDPSRTPRPCTSMPGLRAVALAPTATRLSKFFFRSYSTVSQRT